MQGRLECRLGPATPPHLVRFRPTTRRNQRARGSGGASSASMSNKRARGKPWGTSPASPGPPQPRARSGGAPGAASCCRAQSSAACRPAGPRLLCCGNWGGGRGGAGPVPARGCPAGGTAALPPRLLRGTSNASCALRLAARRRAGPCSCWRSDCTAGRGGGRQGQQSTMDGRQVALHARALRSCLFNHPCSRGGATAHLAPVGQAGGVVEAARLVGESQRQLALRGEAHIRRVAVAVAPLLRVAIQPVLQAVLQRVRWLSGSLVWWAAQDARCTWRARPQWRAADCDAGQRRRGAPAGGGTRPAAPGSRSGAAGRAGASWLKIHVAANSASAAACRCWRRRRHRRRRKAGAALGAFISSLWVPTSAQQPPCRRRGGRARARRTIALLPSCNRAPVAKSMDAGPRHAMPSLAAATRPVGLSSSTMGFGTRLSRCVYKGTGCAMRMTCVHSNHRAEGSSARCRHQGGTNQGCCKTWQQELHVNKGAEHCSCLLLLLHHHIRAICREGRLGGGGRL